jgi:hypothetical protein
MAGTERIAFCRELCKTFNILPLTSELLLSLLSFVADNVKTISNQHRYPQYEYKIKNVYVPNPNLIKYQNGVYYLGYPPDIKSLNYDINMFKPALK